MSIKIGDRVKATNGESVLVGEVTTVREYGKPGIRIRVDGDEGFVVGGRTLHTDSWAIEVILPPEPEVGTIIKFHSGYAASVDNGYWVRSDHVQQNPWLFISGKTGRLQPGANWQWFNEEGTYEIVGRSGQ